VPPRGLPGNANLEQLRNGAKSFQRAVRAGDAGAAEVVREFHPRLVDARPGSPELARFTRADAQLVVARSFNFPSWPRLKAYLETVSTYARSPHDQPVGGPIADERALADEFLRLACLNYGEDDPARRRRAGEMLAANPGLASAGIHTAAAAGDVEAVRALLESDPSLAGVEGGPFGWPPLLYVAFGRVGDRPLGPSAIDVARRLLDAGADPNAGYLWEGLSPPFTALTGAFGSGEDQPAENEHALALARLLLERGADPNDSQTIYNESADGGDGWLALLLEFGLGTGDGGPWHHRLAPVLETPREMTQDALKAAAGNGFARRVALLLEHGVDPDGLGTRHPVYHGRSALQEAALHGHPEIVAMLQRAGARHDLDDVEVFLCAATAGDRTRVQEMLRAQPDLGGRARERHPEQLVRAAASDRLASVALLLELGFDPNAVDRTTPLHVVALHEAARLGDLEMISLLLQHGADPNLRDSGYQATPGGWAEHFAQPEAHAFLHALETPP
jgi:ankyrin repeat protein